MCEAGRLARRVPRCREKVDPVNLTRTTVGASARAATAATNATDPRCGRHSYPDNFELWCIVVAGRVPDLPPKVGRSPADRLTVNIGTAGKASQSKGRDMSTPQLSRTNEVLIRRMGLNDLEFVVDEHLAHFPDNVFGQMGHRFLVEYYRTFLDGPHAEAVVAVARGSRVGFLVGVLDVHEHRQLVRRFHFRRLAWYGVTALASRPRMAIGLMRRRAAVRLAAARRRASAGYRTRDHIAVLSHVAVRPEAQGLGLGTSMILQFMEHAAIAGATTASVATRAGTSGAGGLYERLGWRLTTERDTFDGRRIALYDLDLRTDQ
jgi:ribosomal protein S18 acetylase RimI-like enzyme